MLKNYLRIAFRNFKSQRFYSFTNIFGLSVGITASILVLLYVKHEFSFDSYHKNVNQIYRIGFSFTQEGVTNYCAQTPAKLGPALKDMYPEIKKLSRIYFSKRMFVEAGDIKKFEDRISYADPEFFDIFSYDVISGNKVQFLKNANSIVITESTAKKYFGNSNPLGKIIEIDNNYMFEVNGVIKDVPVNSQFRFDFIAPYASLEKQPVSGYFSQWSCTFGSYTYMLVGNGFDPKSFEKKTANFFKTHTDLKEGDWRVIAVPLSDIHLNSRLADEIEENSSISKIIIISSIALFILLLACINFVNLSTARASRRALEIGIRKVMGAGKSQLVKQFLGESVLISLVALVFSGFTILLIMPSFSTLVGTNIGFNLINNWSTLLMIVGGVVIVGLLAGIYPAFFISSYEPVKVTRGNVSSGDSGKQSSSFLRKGLVVFQFSISIVLIAGTIIVNLQLNYLRGFDMGFDKKQMIVLPVHEKFGDIYKTVKNEIVNIPGVVSVTAGLGAPVTFNSINTVCKPNGTDDRGEFPIVVNSIDYDYMDQFGVQIVAGRNFSEEYSNDFPNSMIINEKMARRLGFNNVKDAIGKSYIISLNNYKPEIIGVVKDFNAGSLHNEISSQVFMINPKWFKELIVKANSTNMPSTISKLKGVWEKFFPKYPFEYSFLDESIDRMYKSEDRYSQVISVFSVVALFIACLGLLGLASFIAKQRKKEIGIRKVHGASIESIIQIVSGEFAILVIIGNLIAWPTAYYFMNKWLQEFAYRVDLSWWIFIVSGLMTLIIAMLTVGYQAIKAAVANPVESLKNE